MYGEKLSARPWSYGWRTSGIDQLARLHHTLLCLCLCLCLRRSFGYALDLLQGPVRRSNCLRGICWGRGGRYGRSLRSEGRKFRTSLWLDWLTRSWVEDEKQKSNSGCVYFTMSAVSQTLFTQRRCLYFYSLIYGKRCRSSREQRRQSHCSRLSPEVCHVFKRTAKTLLGQRMPETSRRGLSERVLWAYLLQYNQRISQYRRWKVLEEEEIKSKAFGIKS